MQRNMFESIKIGVNEKCPFFVDNSCISKKFESRDCNDINQVPFTQFVKLIQSECIEITSFNFSILSSFVSSSSSRSGSTLMNLPRI
jgi:hypothetical protein